MKKFVYSMQSVLNIKEKLEEQERASYGAAQARLNEEMAKLAELNARKDGYEQQLRESVGDALNVIQIRHQEEALESMKVLVRRQSVAVSKAEQNVEAARYKLQQAIMERKAQEKLRENAFEAYKKEMQAEESKEVDELVSYQFGQKAIAAQTGEA